MAEANPVNGTSLSQLSAQQVSGLYQQLQKAVLNCKVNKVPNLLQQADIDTLNHQDIKLGGSTLLMLAIQRAYEILTNKYQLSAQQAPYKDKYIQGFIKIATLFVDAGADTAQLKGKDEQYLSDKPVQTALGWANIFLQTAEPTKYKDQAQQLVTLMTPRVHKDEIKDDKFEQPSVTYKYQKQPVNLTALQVEMAEFVAKTVIEQGSVHAAATFTGMTWDEVQDSLLEYKLFSQRTDTGLDPMFPYLASGSPVLKIGPPDNDFVCYHHVFLGEDYGQCSKIQIDPKRIQSLIQKLGETDIIKRVDKKDDMQQCKKIAVYRSTLQRYEDDPIPHVAIQDDKRADMYRHKMGPGGMFLCDPDAMVDGDYTAVEYYAIQDVKAFGQLCKQLLGS